jgi:hypothetical protein
VRIPLRRSADPKGPRSVAAAAVQLTMEGTSWQNLRFGDARWQKEAWRHYDICGELRFVANWVGGASSRVEWFIAEVDDKGNPGGEADDQDVSGIAKAMFGSAAARAEAMRLMGIHLSVPGQCYVVAESHPDKSDDEWYVASTTEVAKTAGGIQVKREGPDGPTRQLDPDNDLIIKCWTPHPRQYDHADSMTRAVLPELREIEQLTKMTFSKIDSRLAGAGVLFVPTEMDFPKQLDDNGNEVGKAEQVNRMLTKAAAASLKDSASASALVPIVVTAPGEMIGNVKHLTFESSLQKAQDDMRDKAIRRLALGLDVPPEVLLGMSDANHWSAWQIDEGAIQMHVVPVLTRIADALTAGYVRPAIEAMGLDPDRYMLWYDTSPLTVRANRTADAKDLYDRKVISAEVLRRESNFETDDAPDVDELQRRVLLELLDKKPDFAAVILPALGMTADLTGLTEIVQEEHPHTAPAPKPVTPTPNGPPEPATEPAAAAMLACDLLVLGALTRAGGRLLTREHRGQLGNLRKELIHTKLRVDESRLDFLLDGAWELVPRVADQLGVDAERLRTELDQYVRDLLRSGQPHRSDYLKQPVAAIGQPVPA